MTVKIDVHDQNGHEREWNEEWCSGSGEVAQRDSTGYGLLRSVMTVV